MFPQEFQNEACPRPVGPAAPTQRGGFESHVAVCVGSPRLLGLSSVEGLGVPGFHDSCTCWGMLGTKVPWATAQPGMILGLASKKTQKGRRGPG